MKLKIKIVDRYEGKIMNNVLWISFRVPYDGVAHAGGKIHNFYLKRLFAEKKCNIKIISFYNDYDIGKIDVEKYGIDAKLINSSKIETNVSKMKLLASRMYSVSGVNFYLDLVTRKMCKKALIELKKLSNSGYSPDVVILQWTQIIAMFPEVKKYFPSSKFILIEEDVTFLAAQRRKELASSWLKKAYFEREKKCIKKIEKHCLENSDLVILNNRKDEKLLDQNGISAKTWVWTPYFQNMIDIKRSSSINKDIIFYGAMNRPENWMSAIWFIDNVFDKLKGDGYRFIVIGNKPNEKLLKYNDDQTIKVLGFVDDVAPYFENSLCMVAPLLLGAGVKIKILEGMSSGIPVLTNSIGIEGIYAEDGKEYFYCDKAENYIEAIKKLNSSPVTGVEIGEHAKQFIRSNYNFYKDSDDFCKIIMELIESK